MNPAKGLCPNKSVPQEGRAAKRCCLLEQDAGGLQLSVRGVAEDEGGGEGDAAGKEAGEHGKGMRPLGSREGLSVRAEGEEVRQRREAREPTNCRYRAGTGGT